MPLIDRDPEALLAELNTVVNKHNQAINDYNRCARAHDKLVYGYKQLAADFEEFRQAALWLICRLSWQLSLQTQKVREYDRLMSDYDHLLHLAQNGHAWRDEATHLWNILEDLIKECTCER